MLFLNRLKKKKQKVEPDVIAEIGNAMKSLMVFTGEYKITPYERGLREYGYKKLSLEVATATGKQWIDLRHENSMPWDDDRQYGLSFFLKPGAEFLGRWYRRFFLNKPITDVIPSKVYTYVARKYNN